MNKIFSALTEFAGFAAGITILAMWRGYVLSVLWAWFVVATFSVPVLSVPAAIGLFLTVAMFKTIPNKNTNDVAPGVWEKVGSGLLAPLSLMGIGWIVKQFMI